MMESNDGGGIFVGRGMSIASKRAKERKKRSCQNKISAELVSGLAGHPGGGPDDPGVWPDDPGSSRPVLLSRCPDVRERVQLIREVSG